jgi:hypothetical protein
MIFFIAGRLGFLMMVKRKRLIRHYFFDGIIQHLHHMLRLPLCTIFNLVSATGVAGQNYFIGFPAFDAQG